MANFRCGNLWPKWWPAHRHRWGSNYFKNWDETPVNKDFIDSLQCNSCYSTSHSRDALAKVLLSWYCQVLVAELWLLHRHITLGWSLLWDSVDVDQNRISPGDWYALKKYHFEIRTEILAGLPYKNTEASDGSRRQVTYIEADSNTLYMMNQRHKQVLRNWDRWFRQKENDPDHDAVEWNDWFQSWLHGYDNLEAQWVWFRDCQKELLTKPEAVIEWALGDKGGVDVQLHDIWKQVATKLSKNWTSPEIMEL
ncbi:hypothetical protein TruAng_001170 [Truncatella angustata]|nr:hypothetical protein TruAng_001170 [Truncatella angustata]